MMKIEYLYQSTKQIRDAQALTLQSPPQRVTLALNALALCAAAVCARKAADRA